VRRPVRSAPEARPGCTQHTAPSVVVAWSNKRMRRGGRFGACQNHRQQHLVAAGPAQGTLVGHLKGGHVTD